MKAGLCTESRAVSAPRSTAPAGRRSAPVPPRRPGGAASSPFASERCLELTAKEAQSMAYCWCRCVLIIPRVITLQNMWTAFKLPALFLLKPGYIYRASAAATRASPLGCIYSQTQLKVMGRDRRSEGRKSPPGRDPGSALCSRPQVSVAAKGASAAALGSEQPRTALGKERPGRKLRGNKNLFSSTTSTEMRFTL